MSKKRLSEANKSLLAGMTTSEELATKKPERAVLEPAPKEINIVTPAPAAEVPAAEVPSQVAQPDQAVNKQKKVKPYKGAKKQRLQLLARPATVRNIDKYVEELGKDYADNKYIKLSRNELINLILEYSIMNPNFIRESINAYSEYMKEEEADE